MELLKLNELTKKKLDETYVIVYAIKNEVNIKKADIIEKNDIYTLIGVDIKGYKDILGLWIDKTESSSFWSNVFEELKIYYIQFMFKKDEIWNCIYTSNVVEAVNSALRKVTRGKGAFPSESSVYKVLHLRISELKKKWKKPIQNWKII